MPTSKLGLCKKDNPDPTLESGFGYDSKNCRSGSDLIKFIIFFSLVTLNCCKKVKIIKKKILLYYKTLFNKTINKCYILDPDPQLLLPSVQEFPSRTADCTKILIG